MFKIYVQAQIASVIRKCCSRALGPILSLTRKLVEFLHTQDALEIVSVTTLFVNRDS